jgi:hypothetical protein
MESDNRFLTLLLHRIVINNYYCIKENGGLGGGMPSKSSNLSTPSSSNNQMTADTVPLLASLLNEGTFCIVGWEFIIKM